MLRNLFALAVVVALLIMGCAPAAGSASQSRGLHLLATETFLGDIASNVAGDRFQVDTLLTPGVDPHEFQPTPQDAIKISQSPVLIVNGLGYETWLTNSLQDTGGQRLLVIATSGLTPNPDPSGQHPDGDPHMWMDPLKVVTYTQNIRDALSKADPGGKDTYAANAAAYIQKLEDLDAWIKTQVAEVPPGKRLLVTNHDALGYFADAYGFKVVGAVIPSVTNEASPSALQMAGLIDTIKSAGAPAIFLDANENRKLADQIASESGAQVITDLYVETLSAPSGPAPTYIDMLKHDVTTIVAALK